MISCVGIGEALKVYVVRVVFVVAGVGVVGINIYVVVGVGFGIIVVGVEDLFL